MVQLFHKGNMGILQPEIWDKKGVKSPGCYLPVLTLPVLAGKSGWCNMVQPKNKKCKPQTMKLVSGGPGHNREKPRTNTSFPSFWSSGNHGLFGDGTLGLF